MSRIAVICFVAAVTFTATTAAAQTASPARIALSPAEQPQALPAGACARCAVPAGRPAKPQKHASAPQFGW